MTVIYHLDQPTAAAMTDAREALKVYRARNKDGKFDEAIDRYVTRYKNWMAEVQNRKVAA